MSYPPYPDDPALRRLQRQMLAAGVAIVAVLVIGLVLTLPEPAAPRPGNADDVFLAGPGSELVVRMPAEDRGELVVTRKDVREYRVRLASLAARCGGLPEEQTAVIVDRARSLVRETGRPITYARTIAELSFAVELAGDRDCTAAARALAEGAAD